MKRIFLFAIFVLAIVIMVYGLKLKLANGSPIVINSPRADETITSPLLFSGKARGWWYFEASFPVKVVDADGNVLGQTPAQAQGEWMTEDFVPFAGSVEFQASGTQTGKVIFQKDNPSGLPEHDAFFEVAVRF